MTSIVIPCDERYVISGNPDGTLKLWIIATGECLRTFEGHTSSVNSVTVSSDGCYALSGSGGEFAFEVGDCTVKLWEIATGKCFRTFEGHKKWVSTVTISAD